MAIMSTFKYRYNIGIWTTTETKYSNCAFFFAIKNGLTCLFIFFVGTYIMYFNDNKHTNLNIGIHHKNNYDWFFACITRRNQCAPQIWNVRWIVVKIHEMWREIKKIKHKRVRLEIDQHTSKYTVIAIY